VSDLFGRTLGSLNSLGNCPGALRPVQPGRTLHPSTDTAPSPRMSPLALKPKLASADFQQALGTRPVARSAHFAVHFAVPSLLKKRLPEGQLSTGQGQHDVEPVEEVRTHLRVWRLGLVVPKKMARRSVTRQLIKRQARELFRLHAQALEAAGWLHDAQPVGNWVLRLKAPYAKADWPSAASEPLRAAVREEILSVLQQCIRGGKGGARPGNKA